MTFLIMRFFFFLELFGLLNNTVFVSANPRLAFPLSLQIQPLPPSDLPRPPAHPFGPPAVPCWPVFHSFPATLPQCIGFGGIYGSRVVAVCNRQKLLPCPPVADNPTPMVLSRHSVLVCPVLATVEA